jgi:hypothetical protein
MSGPCCCRRDIYDVRNPGGLPVSFVVNEQECVVPPERTANGSAELIARERPHLSWVEVVAGIERAVAQELIDGSMQIVRPERVMALITPAKVRPYSAGHFAVRAENSSIASTPRVPPRALPGPPLL